MSEMVKDRKTDSKISMGVVLLFGFVAGTLLRSKTSPDDPSIRRTTKNYVQAKKDKLMTIGEQKFNEIQSKKKGLQSDAKKSVTQ